MRSFSAGRGVLFVWRKMVIGLSSIAGLTAWKVEFAVEGLVGADDESASTELLADSAEAGIIFFSLSKMKCFDSTFDSEEESDLFMCMLRNTGGSNSFLKGSS